MHHIVIYPHLDHQEKLHLIPDETSPFYSLPPYVHNIDLYDELIIIKNPNLKNKSLFDKIYNKLFPNNNNNNKKEGIDLTGWTLSDEDSIHVYQFPDGYILEPEQSVTVYATPGLLTKKSKVAENHLFWKNLNGSLRKKQLLNDDGDTVFLLDNFGNEIAALAVDDENKKRYYLPALTQKAYQGYRRTSLYLQYLRIILLFFIFFLIRPGILFPIFLILSHMIDYGSRYFSTLCPMDELIRVGSFIGDRLSNLVLLLTLSHLYHDYYTIFGIMIFLDLANSVTALFNLEMVTTHINHWHQRGEEKNVEREDIIGYLWGHHPSILTIISLFSEIYLLFIYIYIMFPIDHEFWGFILFILPDNIAHIIYLYSDFWLLPFLISCVLKQIMLSLNILISFSSISSNLMETQAKMNVLHQRQARLHFHHGHPDKDEKIMKRKISKYYSDDTDETDETDESDYESEEEIFIKKEK